MSRLSAICRVLSVVLVAALVPSLAACVAKCRPGFALEGGRCKAKSIGDGGLSSSAQTNLPQEGSAGTINTARLGAAGDATGRNETTASSTSQSTAGTSSPQAASSTATSPMMTAPPAAESCSAAGAIRCSPDMRGGRETCTNNVWMSSAPCAASEVCVMQQGAAACAALEQLCVGSNGKPVCDGQGTLLACNADGTVSSQEMCKSAKLCQAGLATAHCALCVAGEEHQCTEKNLEVCAPDGMSFVMKAECETTALCNPTAGQCTTAACMPNAFSCENNTLQVCKEDGTGFDETKAQPCGQGTCDAKGADCNMCEPGMKVCMGDSAAVCDDTGQMFQQTPCGQGMSCVGAGNCVECATDDDCSDMTTDCLVGACVQNKCTTKNARAGTACMAGGRPGTCSSGKCECTKQCNKECGEDGCGGMCPNRCGSLMCVNDACVECRTGSDCSKLTSADRCTVGVCNNGTCGTMNAGATSCTVAGTGARGTCSRGQCICTSSCSGKCGGDSDGCGGSCPNPCSSGQQCSAGRCTDPSVCPKNSFGCGTGSTPECWNCSRTITSGQIAVFQCNEQGSAFTPVDYCVVADCTDMAETATCASNSSTHCIYNYDPAACKF